MIVWKEEIPTFFISNSYEVISVSALHPLGLTHPGEKDFQMPSGSLISPGQVGREGNSSEQMAVDTFMS